MGCKIKKIRERLDKVATDKNKYDLINQNGSMHNVIRTSEREMTHSFVRASEIIGRDGDKENIIDFLLQVDDGRSVDILPIVGIGGLGKTALAKLVYNDERIDEHFERKIWVCVSVEFSLKRLIERMIKCVDGDGEQADVHYSNLEMQQLQKILQEKIGKRKYLLIIDDIWNDDQMKWYELKDLLMVGATGSKIVVTTRNFHVASIMSPNPAYKLSHLPHDKCMSLFVKYAFKEGEHEQFPNLVGIGEEIVKKCAGVPLAVKTLAILLFSKTDERDWKFVRDNHIWQLEQKENDILPALRISYEQLPSYLKRCFAYCAIFPKDYTIHDFELVQHWMAQGLIQSSNKSKDIEDIGFSYVKELSSRGFFEDIVKMDFSIVFKMHDLMRELASWVAQNEALIVTGQSEAISKPKSVRHLSFPDPYSFPKNLSAFLCNVDRVRTLSFLSEYGGFDSESVTKECLSRSPYLRVLDLTASRIEELPSGIGTMKHLRYINLFGNSGLRKFPKSFWKLQNLTGLVFVECKTFEKLPTNIRYLINLRYLCITTMQVQLPKGGIGRLNSLRFLWIFFCVNIEYLFEDMQGLQNLRTLHIDRCNKLISLPPGMKYLSALKTLAITDCRELDLAMVGEPMINTHFRLRKLVIINLPKLVDFPEWLLQGSASTLKVLVVGYCRNLKELPECMQNLTSLQELEIGNCNELTSRCQRETGEDWPKIAHIPKILVDGINIIANNN